MWTPKIGTCSMCGAEYERMSPRQRFCDACREKNEKEYSDRYNKCYRKNTYVPVVKQPNKKELRRIKRQNTASNLEKAVQAYGPYGLELVQSFFNILHRAGVIAKKNGMQVNIKAIDTIMNDFRQNKIGHID